MNDIRGLEFRPPLVGAAGMDGLERGYDDGDGDDETDLLAADIAEIQNMLTRILVLLERIETDLLPPF